MGYFHVRYDCRVVIYNCRASIRFTTDLAKFCHLGKLSKVLGKLLRVYLVFGKILNQLCQKFWILDKSRVGIKLGRCQSWMDLSVPTIKPPPVCVQSTPSILLMIIVKFVIWKERKRFAPLKTSLNTELNGWNRIVGKDGLWVMNLEPFFGHLIHVQIWFKNCITKTSSGKRGRLFSFLNFFKNKHPERTEKMPNWCFICVI